MPRIQSWDGFFITVKFYHIFLHHYITYDVVVACRSSFKWRVKVSAELMLLESYSNCDVTNTVILLL